MGMPHWSIAAFTHRGRVRPANEDAIAIDTRILTGDMSSPVVMTAPGNGCLLMVADGMGGHAQGAMASRAVLDYLVATADRISNPESCAEAIEDANQHLYALMQQHEAAFGMGTTLVGAVLTPTALLTFNVGDSRCYLLSANQLIQLSQDDVAEEGNNRSGHRRSHAITQARSAAPRSPLPSSRTSMSMRHSSPKRSCCYAVTGSPTWSPTMASRSL
jgi:PPM family protein phosphatase